MLPARVVPSTTESGRQPGYAILPADYAVPLPGSLVLHNVDMEDAVTKEHQKDDAPDVVR